MLPEQHICTKNELIARVLSHYPPLREKRWTESDASHHAIPFGIVATEEMAIGHCQAQLIARKGEMLGGGYIYVWEV